MGKPFTQIYLHLVWATWDRLPLITSSFENRLYACLRQDILQLSCEAIALGGIEDHVHVLIQTPPTRCASEIIKQLKGNSSHLVNQQVSPVEGFKWQGYYGAFSVSRGDLRRVEDYVNKSRITSTTRRNDMRAADSGIAPNGLNIPTANKFAAKKSKTCLRRLEAAVSR